MLSQVCGVSSGELISGCDPPGGCQDARKTWLATGGLLTVWWRMLSLGPRLPFSLKLWLSLACFSASGSGEGPARSRLALLWCSLNPLLVLGPGCELEPFSGQILSLSFVFPLWKSHSLGCYLTLAPSDYPQGIQAWSLP